LAQGGKICIRLPIAPKCALEGRQQPHGLAHVWQLANGKSGNR
jgi:hypothetical protein